MTGRQWWISQPASRVLEDTPTGLVLAPCPSEVPDLDRIVPVLLEHGLERLPEHCRLSPGTGLRESPPAPCHPPTASPQAGCCQAPRPPSPGVASTGPPAQRAPPSAPKSALSPEPCLVSMESPLLLELCTDTERQAAGRQHLVLLYTEGPGGRQVAGEGPRRAPGLTHPSSFSLHFVIPRLSL